MYSHTFTLTQHTHHIHFQGEQHNATLRATEVKPRFDAFLSEYAKLDNYKIPNCSASAYNYKLRIICENSEKQQKTGHYFGKAEKTEMYTYSEVKAIFSSYHKELCEKIIELFPIFCIITNFGACANKGYGSFTVAKIDEKNYTCNLIEDVLKTYTKAEIVLIKENITKNQLNTIKYDYQLLKSGNNFNNKYKKSTLFLYFIKEVNPSIRWEKRCIKHEIEKKRKKIDWGKQNILFRKKKPINVINVNNSWKDTNHWDDENDNFEYGFVRALLGLAERHEYLKVKINNNGTYLQDRKKINISISHTQKEIERIPSPLYFKVIGSTIYLIGYSINPDILGKEFTFTIDNDSASKFNLTIPEKFSVKKFLEFAISKEAEKSIINYKTLFTKP